MKQIKEYPNYLITKQGKIWSKWKKDWKSIFISNCGYKRIHLLCKGKGKNFSVHRLVAETYLLNLNKYPVVNHKNGNKLDNRVQNLEWTTRSENEKHAFFIGLKSLKGEKNTQAKLTSKSVKEIRELKGKMLQKDIGKLFNVSRSCINLILNNKRWFYR